MFDLKVINSVLEQLEEERGVPKEKVFEAIEIALATAYKKEYGKKGQIIRAKFDVNTGTTEFNQVKIVVDDSRVRMEEDDEETTEDIGVEDDGDERVRFNPEHHILIEDARKIKKGAQLDEEITFPLEAKDDYGRIAAQTAKQVIIQKIREAEKVSILEQFGQREGEVVTGSVQRIDRGNIFVDLGRAPGMLPYDEQIQGERYRQGERIRAYLCSVEETPKGVFLKLSRSHPQFLAKLFEQEAPELGNESIEIKVIAREAGSRSKIAVVSHDEHIDPVGSLVGQRGVRVSTVMSELGGEKIDIIEWSEDPEKFVEDALSPAKILNVNIDEKNQTARVEVSPDQQSLAIGRGGQNVRLAAKLTGWKIDIQSLAGESVAEADGEHVEISEDTKEDEKKEKDSGNIKENEENTAENEENSVTVEKEEEVAATEKKETKEKKAKKV